MDETWISQLKKKIKVLVPREWKTAPSIIDDQATMHITMIFCASADGVSVHPTAILPKLKSFPQDLGEFRNDFVWSASESGWITEPIFREWASRIFLSHVITKRIFWKAPPSEPALLFLDSHSTRNSPEALELLRSHNVFTVTIPAHTSHIIQPMDRGVNLSFKEALRKKLRSPEDSSASAR